MAIYKADVFWALTDGEDFLAGRYSRGHAVSFDGGVCIPGSASPHVVGKWAVNEAVDPEEMLVAALSTCHMLSFLHVARLAGFIAATYRDGAKGVMETISLASRPSRRWSYIRSLSGQDRCRTRPNWTRCIMRRTRLASLPTQ
jgi:organic hydroperoxide reductase OsmC/OhrA